MTRSAHSSALQSLQSMQSVLPAVQHAPPRSRFLSEAECQDIAQRLARYSRGGGEVYVHIVSRWQGNVRWARNRITTSGEDRDNRILLRREIRGAATQAVQINEISDAALIAAARRAERLVHLATEIPEADFETQPGSPWWYQREAAAVPALFSEATYQLDADRRAEAAQHLMQAARAAGLLSAGYLQVSATSLARITSWGFSLYYQYTWAQYTNTVRDPSGVGSGWAGVDWPDWAKIDGDALSALALDKCLKSRNPVSIEPGRYTTILEPQAVCDFIAPWGVHVPRDWAENNKVVWNKNLGGELPFGGSKFGSQPAPFPRARFGEKVIDERLTIQTDPMDPEAGYPPYPILNKDMYRTAVYHPATWIEQGVLKELEYDREYGARMFGRVAGLENSGAFRMRVTGTTSSMPEMIATTKRGVLVTRFDSVRGIGDFDATLYRGFTRDGVWLIENGQISKPIKNLVFTESVLFALNNVEQVGVPQRTFHPGGRGDDVWLFNPAPVVVPALKIRDFSFTALSSAV